MRKIFFFLSLSLIFLSCNENATDGNDTQNANSVTKLKGEVMRVHDEAMAKKGDVQSLLTSLKVAKFGNTQDSLAIQEAYKALKEVDQNMMTWMREFKQPEEQGWTDKEQTSYLEEELGKMSAINTATAGALNLANSTLSGITPVAE